MFRRLSGAAAAVLLLTATLSAPAEARRIDEVQAKVQAVIDDLGIDRSRIQEIFVSPDRGGRRAPPQSFSAWVAFSDCTGNLALHLSATAAVRTIYTTGDCVVPGVSKGG